MHLMYKMIQKKYMTYMIYPMIIHEVFFYMDQELIYFQNNHIPIVYHFG
jgi:hypothetical protein